MRFIKRNWPIILAAAVLIFNQFVYWRNLPEFGDCYDCGEYQDLARFISGNPKNIISDFRPPLYPIFLNFTQTAEKNDSSDFRLYVIQSFLLIISLFASWKLFLKFNIPRYVGAITLLLLTLSPSFFSYTKYRLTETWNVFLLLLAVLVACRLLESFRYRYILLLSVIFTALSFLRFANSYLGLIVLFIIAVYRYKSKDNNKLVFKIILAFIFLTAPQFIYSNANLHRNYYYGLTGETGTNLLGKLVQYKFIPKEDQEFENIVRKTSKCTGTLATSDVFTCIWDFLPKNSFVSKYSVENSYVDAFAKKYILKNLPGYLIKSAEISLGAIQLPNDSYLILSRTPGRWFEFERALSKTIHQYLFYWLLITMTIIVIIKPRRLSILSIPTMLAIILYYLAITGLAAINDYQRILSPTLPFIYLLVTYTTYLIIRLVYYRIKHL